MSVRKKLVQEARKYLRETHGVTQVCCDMIKGINDSELETYYDDYLQRVIDDTVYWENCYE